MEYRQCLSRYRNELKGVAILWIVFFHALIPCTGILLSVQKIGYGGVDLFFFLTGFGLYHSLKRDGDLRTYWGRRMRRILPAYLPLIAVWMIIMYPGYGLSTVQAIRGVMGNFLMVGYWFETPGLFNWYVSCLVLFLLLAPFLYGFLSKSKSPLRSVIGLMALSVGIGLCCVGRDAYMGISRLPVFILGMAFAMEWKLPARKGLLWLAGAAALTGGIALVLVCHDRFPELLNTYAMYWHPFVFITPPLCVFLAFALQKARKAEKVFAPLRWLGRASFEVYLFNIWAVELGKKWGFTGAWAWFGWSVAAIAVGLAYHWLIGRCLDKSRKVKAG